VPVVAASGHARSAGTLTLARAGHLPTSGQQHARVGPGRSTPLAADIPVTMDRVAAHVGHTVDRVESSIETLIRAGVIAQGGHSGPGAVGEPVDMPRDSGRA
jgi:hypothetical protein